MACAVLAVTGIVCLYAYNGKSMQMTGTMSNSTDNELVQAVLSSPGNVGPLGVLAGRSCNEKTRREAFNELLTRHPDWNWDLIQENRITAGMTEHELRLAWGNPYRIYRDNAGELWVHVRVSRFFIVRNVYVENGYVAGWD